MNYLRYDSGNVETSDCGISSIQSNYPHVYSEQANRNISHNIEPNMKYTNRVQYVHVSSNDRDTVNYPKHYDYMIKFDTPFRNVKCVEMISAIVPNQPASSSGGDILNEPFLIVDIDELNFIEFPNSGNSVNRGFAILPLKTPTKGSGGFINPELGCIYKTVRIFDTPTHISRMSIKIRDMNGNLYDFGSSGSTSKTHQNSFVFKIVTEEVQKGNDMKYRNVY
ncbi:MAG TPA: hypothetical protein V6C58_05775 [Allocoleopsis sp.]